MRYHLLLIALLALLASPALHAERIRFEALSFAITLPDSGWRWDNAVVRRDGDPCVMVLKASNEEGNRRLTVLLLDDSGSASVQDYLPGSRYIGIMLKHHAAHPLDTMLSYLGRAMGWMVTTGGGGRELPLAMRMSPANGRCYAIVTGMDEGRPEEDSELEAIVKSFEFIGEPTDISHAVICITRPPPLLLIYAPHIIATLAGIGGIVGGAILLARRRRMRRDREWIRA